MRPARLAPAAPLVVSLSLSLLCAASAHAGWILNGSPVCTELGDQLNQQMVADGAGGTIIVWQDQRSGGWDIYALRLTALGDRAAGWPLDGRAVCTAAGDQTVPVLCSDGAGGAILAWQDKRAASHDVYALRLTAAGAIAAGWSVNGNPVCALPSAQYTPTIVSDGAGGALVAWADARGTNWDVYAHHVSGAGVLDAAWPVDGLQLVAETHHQLLPMAVTDGAGGMVVTWVDYRAVNQQLYAQRVLPAGALAPGWPADGAFLSPAVSVNPRALAPDMLGGVYNAWDADYSPAQITHLDGSGALAAGAWPRSLGSAAGSTGSYAPNLAPDGVGGVLAAWYEPYSGYDIAATRLMPNGFIQPGWSPVTGVCMSVFSDQFNPQVAPDGAGGAYIGWMDRRYDRFSTDIFMQRVLANGTIPSYWTPNGDPVCIDGAEQNSLRLAPDDNGGVIALWSDWRNGNFFFNQNADLFATRLWVSGPVPVQIALVSAEAHPDHVTLTWSAAGAVASAVVERTEDGAGWRALGTILPDGTGRLVYEDRDIVPGARYGYRLTLAEAGRDLHAGETWVTVPGMAFALQGLTPNPASRGLGVAFSLAREAPARIELIDVTGRRVAEREVGSLGAGPHVVDLGDATRLEPGVYLVRLTQDGRSLVARGCIVR